MRVARRREWIVASRHSPRDCLPAKGVKPDDDEGRDSRPSPQNIPPAAICTSVMTRVFDKVRFIDWVKQASQMPGERM